MPDSFIFIPVVNLSLMIVSKYWYIHPNISGDFFSGDYLHDSLHNCLLAEFSTKCTIEKKKLRISHNVYLTKIISHYVSDFL